jgi:hypothetical protein
MPRRRLPVLPVSRATPFHIIYQYQAKRRLRLPLTPFADGVASPFITPVNNGLRFPLWGRFFDPLLATWLSIRNQLMLSAWAVLLLYLPT